LSPLGRVKRKGSSLARWEAKPSRSKNERIIDKMGAAQSEGGEDKKISKLKECVRRRGILERREKYTHVLRARGA
jgi:hypothetical protein